MAPEPAFARVAVLGTGLIGGSFALALRKLAPTTRIVGWDRADVLERARARGAIDEGLTELPAALRDADLVYLALPIVRAIELLSEIARHARPGALVTDASSTKVAICRAAETCFGSSVHFLGGHPMAGKEASGIENADAELFRDTKYILMGSEADSDPLASEFRALVEAMGAKAVWCDAETHDWAVGIVSHLAQLASVALAEVVLDETDETGMPLTLAGPALRDLLRLAGSPYEIWRDICLTNSMNLTRALDRLAQAIDRLRTRLTAKELEEEFAAANKLYSLLRDLQ
jgi:prephenate dehydrogenase